MNSFKEVLFTEGIYLQLKNKTNVYTCIHTKKEFITSIKRSSIKKNTEI